MQPTPPTEKDTGCPQNSQQVIELEKSAVFFMVEAIGAALEFDLTRVQERAPFLEILTPSIKNQRYLQIDSNPRSVVGSIGGSSCHSLPWHRM